LTEQLLQSSPEDRAALFESAYTQLYAQCPWLNRPEPATRAITDSRYRHFIDIIGRVPKLIYEIGSGTGGLIRYLAALGHECVATEITTERGKVLAAAHDSVAWHATDGIRLLEFEPAGTYDIAISSDVNRTFSSG